MTMSKELGKLEEEALKRKERLKNLKRKIEEKPEENSTNAEIPKPLFRSYKPDEELQVTEDMKLPSIEDDIKDHLEEMKKPLEVTDIDITNLAPKKVDFDLKRSINRRLQKLEKRTQKAISELIRERLDSTTLLEQVNIGARETQKNAEEDDSD